MRFSLRLLPLTLALACQPPGAPLPQHEGARDASRVQSASRVPPDQKSEPQVMKVQTSTHGSYASSDSKDRVRRAVQEERWEDAAHLFDTAIRSPSSEQRFQRARMALALSDDARALALLEGLDVELPAIATWVIEARKAAEEGLAAARPTSPKPSAVPSELPTIAVRPKSPRTKLDIYQKAEKHASQGKLNATLKELERMSLAKGRSPSRADVARTTAWAYYKSRRDYSKAAKHFGQAATWSSAHRAQDLFYEARAWSRANQDHKAIKLYKVMRRRFPKSKWAEEAHYLGARLYYFLGEWKQATASYTDYLRARGAEAKHIVGARYARAVSALVSKNATLAREDLAWLIKRTHSKRDATWYRYLAARAEQLSGESRLEVLRGRYRAVVKDRPLSFAALMSVERLRLLGERQPSQFGGGTIERDTSPPSSDNVSGSPPIALTLPADVAILTRLGLDFDAEVALNAAAPRLKQRYAPRGNEALCQAYGQLSTGKFGYRHGLKIVRERVLLRAVTDETRWLWRCVYPTPFKELVRDQARVHSLPSSLIFGVMRQESAFNARVKSHVGAEGLMQLMPATAREMSERIKAPLAASRLARPANNILLGTAYLKRVVDRFDGHHALAVAAYNAGPGAVLRWLRASPGLELDLFVARIPYDETRGYVRRVVSNWARYAYLHGAPLPTLPMKLPLVPSKKDDDF